MYAYRFLLVATMLACAACERPGTSGDIKSTPALPPASASAAGGQASPGVMLPDFSTLVDRQGPAVVNVVTTRRARPGQTGQAQPPDPLADFLRRFMPDAPGNNPPERGEGLGSGFIISQDGYVLTNGHVVAGADEVTVRLADARREFRARVIGVDQRTDVALLKVEATGLPAVTVGNSQQLKVGEWVVAIGSPFGFANTVTAGIVSAKGRSLPNESYVPFIQTDVAVNPGNSGGPLLNLKGEVIGINSMIYSGTGGYMGVSFAIPIEVAIDVSNQLRTTGKVTRGRLGVGIQELTLELARTFGQESAAGALVSSVERGSPAEKAGMQPGDIVIQFNGKAIESANDLPNLVAQTKPGTQVAIIVQRRGEQLQLNPTLGEFQSEPARQASAQPSSGSTRDRLGLVVRELTGQEKQVLGGEYGLLVEEATGAAAAAIRPGDVILGVNQSRISSPQQFRELITRQKPDSLVALLVRRGGTTLYVPIRTEAG